MKRMISSVKSEKLAEELKDLETRGDDELKHRWRSLYGTKPPQKIHRSLLIAAVAHRIQENAFGPLKPSVRRHLSLAVGQRYKSLSEVARVITGSRWSGPLFFGLKAVAKDSN